MTPAIDDPLAVFRQRLTTSAAIAALLVGVLVLAGCDKPQQRAQQKPDANATTSETAVAPTTDTAADQPAKEKDEAMGRTAPAIQALDGSGYAPLPPPAPFPSPEVRDRYENVKPNPVKLAKDEPVSTFSADVDTASYAVVRKYLTDGSLPPRDAVRIETTQSHFVGNHVVFGTTPDPNGFFYQSTTPVTGSNLYANVLPSVQFQYAFTPTTNLRAGYGRGIARPNFADLPPFILETDNDMTLFVGNPDLKPTSANNYDLLIERYLKPVGLIQAGVFYKDLRNPIFAINSPITTPTCNLCTQTQPTNGTKAHIFGIEATYQQLLRFLPGPLNGLGVSANYSYTTSKAIVPGRTDQPSLVRQGPNNWNLGVTYDKRRLSARVGLTHNDAYIYQYNFADGADLGLRGPNGDVYTYAHTQLDAQGSYRVHGGFKFVVSLLNLNNEVFGFYQGSPQYPTQREFYSRTYAFGFRWSNNKD